MLIMPPHDAPFRAREVRDLYRKGTWAYALGKPAWTHPKYKQAVEIARRGRKGQPSFNPWWIRNHSDVHAVLDGCWMDEAAGRRVVDFCAILRHFEGEFAGRQFVLSDWQAFDIIIPVFGWRQPNGTRRFRRVHNWVPKKNGKTSLAAALILYFLIGDDEPAAEIFTAAVDRKQSGKMFRSVVQMARRSPSIARRVEIVESRYRVVYPATASFYEALSGEVIDMEGANIYAMMKDEAHVWPSRAMHDTVKHGGASRRQPIDWLISTSGKFDPTSFGYQEYDFCQKHINAVCGTENIWEFFGYICGLTKEEEDSWREPAMCVKANPNIDISIKLVDDQKLCDEAAVKPGEVPGIKRYRRNIWVNALNAWMPMDKWDACRGDYTLDDLRGKTCYGGIDCSLSNDIFSLDFCFPPPRGCDKYRFWGFYWVPEGVVAQRDEEYNGMYSRWIASGHLLTTPGETVNQEFIRQKMHEARDLFALRATGYDRAFAQKLAQDLENDGFDVGAFGQGFPAMNEPTRLLYDLTIDGKVEHPGSPVFDWALSNAQSIEDGGGRIRIVKNWGSGPGKPRIRYKIDPVIARIESLGTSQLDPVGVFDVAELIR